MNNMDGFYDIHAHILPGVDDGSGSMDETVQMLKAAYEQKIRTMIATPHYMAGADNIAPERLSAIRDEVEAQARQLNQDFKIYLGNELYYSDGILDALKSKKALTLAESRYVLVEFSVRETYENMYRGMGDLVRAGYAPIIAHVERYSCLYKKEDFISDLIELGCYIQMNSSSVIGGIFDSEAVNNRKLINQGLVHFLGSDCHDKKVRIPIMQSAAKTLYKKCDENTVNGILRKNPLNILENTYI